MDHEGIVSSKLNGQLPSRLLTTDRSPEEDPNSALVKRKRRKIAPEEASSLKCLVCDSPAFGYNFDVISCESCKAFFRRNALKGANRLSTCVRDGACSVNSNSRKHCPSCRMKKCLEAGMRKELITPMDKLVHRANYRGKRAHRKNSMNNSINSDVGSDIKEEAVASSSHEDDSLPSHHSAEEKAPPRAAVAAAGVVAAPGVPPSAVCGSGGNGGGGGLVTKPEPFHSVGPPHLPPDAGPSDLMKMRQAYLDRMQLDVKSGAHPAGPSEEARRLAPPPLPEQHHAAANNNRMPEPPGSDTGMNELSWRTAMFLRGQVPPPDTTPKNDSPPVDPASFMGAMKEGLPSGAEGAALVKHSLSSIIAEVTNMQPKPARPGRKVYLMDDTYKELFGFLKMSYMCILKPLKKEEVMRTQLSEMPNNLEGSFNHMESMVRTVISVLKCLPQFVLLSRDLQIALLKRAIHGLFAFCGSLAYDSDHQGFRIVFEEDNGEMNIFYLDFRNYVSRGLNQIRQTTWGRSEMGEAMLAPYIDKVDQLIVTNEYVFGTIRQFTKNDRFLVIVLLCTRLFREPLDDLGVSLNEGAHWLISRTANELTAFLHEYVARTWPDEDVDGAASKLVSLFETIKLVEKAGQQLTRLVHVDSLNPLMREFLTYQVNDSSQSDVTSSCSDPSLRPSSSQHIHQ